MDEITQELYRREIARREFLPYCRYVYPGWQEGRPQIVLADALEKVRRREITRLMVSMPPRHGKSVMAQLFSCFILGNEPKSEIIYTTYAHPLSSRQSRKARDIFVSRRNRNVFPESQHVPGRAAQSAIAVARQAADEWGTAQGGMFYAAGVGGAVTGTGADFAIADDLIKNREEANSPTIRQKAWDFYTSTLRTRLSPTGVVILIMTRWHPDDPMGRIEEQIRKGETDEDWHIINLPAWDDSETVSLWPERWPVESLRQTKSAIGEYEWSALYMGRPVLRGGNMFKIDRVNIHKSFDSLNITAPFVRAWDLASTEKELGKNDPDFTAGALVAAQYDGNNNEHCYVADIRKCQAGALARNNLIIQTAKDDGDKIPIVIEAVAGYKDAVAEIRKMLRDEGLTRTVIAVSGKDLGGDKVVRATPVEAIIENYCFHVLQSSWTNGFIKTASEFPNGSHDDEIDAVVLAYQESHKRMRRANMKGDIRKALGI